MDVRKLFKINYLIVSMATGFQFAVGEAALMTQESI